MHRQITRGLGVALILAPALLQAATAGNWSGSARSWNGGDFTGVSSTMTGAGHVVAADAAISAANLSGYDMFVIGEATATPPGGELSDLASWVDGGGCLIISVDSGTNVAASNAILAGIGSTMVFGGGPTNAPLAGGVFFTEGPPYNIVGQSLATSPGQAVTGGTTLGGGFLHVEQLGTGWVFAMGDRWDHNFTSPSNANPNGQIFLNAAEGCGNVVPPPPTEPVPGLNGLGMALLVAALLLLGLITVRRVRERSPR